MLRAIQFLLGSALVLIGCSNTPAVGTASLTLSASPTTIGADGGATTLTLTAVDPGGNPGSGTVTLTAVSGAFDGGNLYDTVALAGGTAVDTFRCDRSRDPSCSGPVSITASWSGQISTTRVTVTSGSTTPDAGPPSDAGNPGSDAGFVDAGPPANILYVPSPNTLNVLGIQASGVNTSTTLTFQVVDVRQKGVPNIGVDFTVSGEGGAQIQPSGVTDNSGQVSTILQSGSEVGIASITATVADAGLFVVAPGVAVVGARVSDEGFVAECTEINLAANATGNPPLTVTTPCAVKLNDRFGNPVGISTSVLWDSEAGTIGSPVSSKPFDPGGAIVPDPAVGTAGTTFSTAGQWPPADTAPFPGEPVNPTTVFPWSTTGKNPRDMLVTIIAMVSGEEEFYDGSGTSNGVKNGKWDPGEWFVDVSEPYIDENDNGQYDVGEPFFDEPQLDCATGIVQPGNRKWDGPNGCWDANILLWRPVHVVYSGAPTQFHFFQAPPYQVPVSPGTLTLNYFFYDDFFNRLSPDNANATINLVGSRGGASIAPEGSMNFRTFGFDIAYERAQVTESTPGVYTVNGPCDPSLPFTGSTTLPIKTRCMRRYDVRNFNESNFGSVTFNGAGPTADGGSTSALLQLTGSNQYTTGTGTFPVTFLGQ